MADDLSIQTHREENTRTSIEGYSEK